MSTLKTNAILDASGGTTATVNGYTPTASNMAGRNKIINGGMVIDQRNAGASVTPTTSAYVLDRWQAVLSQASKYSVQQNAGAITPPAGYKSYLGVTSLSAYSVGVGDFFTLTQYIEGLNASDLGFGLATASTVTLSFLVRSSLTGSFGGSLQNSAQNRCYPFTYTINTANTWEQKTLTIAGDTSGTWLTDTGRGVGVLFGLGVGSTYGGGTAGSWVGSQVFVPSGSTSVVGTNGATFYVTGVQLEAGAVATDFEYRLYSTELALCQRYFQNGHVYCLAYSSTGSGFGDRAPFPTVMRATPSITYSNTVYLNASGITTNEVDIYGVSPQVATTTNGATRYISDFAAAAEL